jgi:hypothetical protein
MKFKRKDAEYNSMDPLLTMPDGSPIMRMTKGQFDSPLAYQFKKIVTKTFPREDGSKDERSFKTLRKTGATFCTKREFGTEVLYLAHKPKTMAARFYADTPFHSLDRILCYMEKDFGLVEQITKRWQEPDEQPE